MVQYFRSALGGPLSIIALPRSPLSAETASGSTLESKAPDELEPYREFVVEVAQSVADAAGGGEAAESGAIEKVRSAVA